MYRIGNEEIQTLKNVIEAGSLFKINDGLQASKNVEAQLRKTMGCDYAIFMTSGQAALTSALIAMGIGPGDEVIVPAYTYISTAMAVVAVGAIPVIAEVDDTLTLCPIDTERKITSRTKAIIPVHIQGFPCAMDAILKIAQKHDLFVLEDACQADGGSYHGKRLGTLGTAGALSFNYYKIITCGEGGGLLTNDKLLFERAMIYHDSSAVAFFGDQTKDFETELFCGSEYRSNELCAAVLGVQLTRLDEILQDLRRNKAYLQQKLSNLCCFTPSNDPNGDCGTTLSIYFETEEKARAFATAEGVEGWLPIDTGKHVYKNWTAIMEKRGAPHPLMDPFKMPANRETVPDYREDMCPQSLDVLSKNVYIAVSADWTTADMDAKIQKIRAALLRNA